MKPDYDRAATAAMQFLKDNNIRSTPISPLPLLRNIENVQVRSYEELSEFSGISRDDLIMMYGLGNQDAATTVIIEDGKPYYIVAYNMYLPSALIQRALARELGHIVLGHDGTLPQKVRQEEALCFAHHLLCPRPLIKAVQDSGLLFTVELLGSMTGCYDHCMMEMRKLPGVHVPADLNRQIREQFSKHINNFLRFQLILSEDDTSRIAMFGSYMDFYEE